MSVFVSFCHSDESWAASAAAIFEEDPLSRYEVFRYTNSRLPGARIENHILGRIEDVDIFLLVVTDSSANSEWVRNELGFAVQLQAKRRAQVPLIVPVFVSESGPTQIIPLDPETSKPLQPVFLKEYDGIQLSESDSEATWVLIRENHALKFETMRQARGRIHDMWEQLLNLYVNAFPDARDRIDPSVLYEADGLSDGYYSLTYVQTLGSQLQGFISLTGPVSGKWLFGNYLTVHPAARLQDRAREMIAWSVGEVLGINPEFQGIVFEVQPVNIGFLLSCIAGSHEWDDVVGQLSPENLMRFHEELSNFARVMVYQYNKCRLLCDRFGHPVSFRQPDMSGEIKADGELEFWIMARVLGMREDADDEPGDESHELLNFVYQWLFLEHSYASKIADPTEWRRYIARLSKGIEDAVKKPGRLKRYVFPPKLVQWYNHNKQRLRPRGRGRSWEVRF